MTDKNDSFRLYSCIYLPCYCTWFQNRMSDKEEEFLETPDNDVSDDFSSSGIASVEAENAASDVLLDSPGFRRRAST